MIIINGYVKFKVWRKGGFTYIPFNSWWRTVKVMAGIRFRAGLIELKLKQQEEVFVKIMIRKK